MRAAEYIAHQNISPSEGTNLLRHVINMHNRGKQHGSKKQENAKENRHS
jgi:hypothetical protein